MSATHCPNCGADLSASQSLRIATYSFGRLTDNHTEGSPQFTVEVQDAVTLLCTACKRVIKTTTP